jgi:hypothetical protein
MISFCSIFGIFISTLDYCFFIKFTSLCNSDLVDFAAQDNFAAIQSPPILIAPNTSRRKKRKEKHENKTKTNHNDECPEITNDEHGIQSYNQTCCAYAPVDNNTSNVNLEDKQHNFPLVEHDRTIDNIPESSSMPLITFSKIQQRLSKTLDDDTNDAVYQYEQLKHKV